MTAIQKGHGPRLPRSESLQKMLDLEKQFKLARIQGQPTPSSPALGTMTAQSQAQAAPLQTRHRESLESPFLQSRLPSMIPTSADRPGHNPPLSVSIPTPVEDAGDDDDAKSEQSSICQSPSWEGYGQKKKDKKKKQEAEQQRRDKSKPSPDLAKRRTTNRLFKTPRPASTEPDHTRPPVSMTAGRTTPSGYRSLVPEVWRGQTSQPLARPPVSRSTSAISDQQNIKTPSKKKGAARADAKGTHEKAYPPLSSRSYALRHSLLPVHTRQKSAPSLAAATVSGGGLIDEQTRTPKDNYLYATKNKSDQSVDYTPESAAIRGRQSVEPMLTSTSTSTSLGGYVHHVRAQSIERSIKGFMQDAALSDPNLLNAPNRMAFSYIGPRKTAEEKEAKNQPSSSQSNMSTGRSADASDDYFTLMNTNALPGVDPSTPSSGILSSIKSRISRRSSISSGSTSNTGKSFRERALGAMHLQSNSSDTGSLPSKPLSQNLSPLDKLAVSTDLGLGSASAATTQSGVAPAPTLHQDAEKDNDKRLLPKAARVLGEINQQTMAQGTASHSRPSEGSSASSCHEDTSVPPSPASTPDTSRPQSTKDMAAAIDGDVGDIVGQGRKASTETLSADREASLTDGLEILDEAWSQSTVAADNDAQSFVTTLTNQRSAASLRSQAGILSLKEAALLADQDLGTHPALKNEDTMKHRLPRLMMTSKEEPSKDLKDVKEMKDPKDCKDLSGRKDSKGMPSEPVKANAATSPLSAVYLQEARRSARMVASPLSQAIRSAKALSAIVARGDVADAGASSKTNTLPTPVEMLHLQLPPKQPMAKMLVECCHCKFFHDMPSRVYECMAQPDAVVTDSALGVSGAITTMVKCPWCAHNMSTACCAGYAAVVYLKERLH